MRRHASRRLLALAAAFVVSAVAAGAAGAYHSGFVRNYCNYNAPQPTSYFTRDGSATVALRGRWEGYQWGGGCWNDNDVDDARGDPTQDPNTGGEGGDCSGFTFKVWRESTNTADRGAYQWNMLRDVHGPYSSGSFMNGVGEPNVTYPKSGLIRMDALASTTHMGMVYARNADGSDQMIEAKGEAYGTNIWTRTYRGDSSFGGVRRLGWSA